LQLAYPEKITENHLNSIFNEHNDLDITCDTPYDKIYKTLSKDKNISIPSSFRLINKDKTLTRLSICSTGNNTYALIFSLTHIIADGSTYYQIFNMLCKSAKVVALNVHRKHSYSMKEAIGKADNNFIFSKSYMCNLIFSTIFSAKAKYFAYYIDAEAIKQSKAKLNNNANVSYLSTNDILTSEFMRAIKARLCMMVINFRNRFPDITSNDAGNYEGVMFYDAGIYQSPANIRQSISSLPLYKTRTKALPGAWQRLRMKSGQINNWASFSGGFNLDNCKPLLHLPMMPTSVPFDCAVIFNPVPNKTAILVMSKNFTKNEFINNPENPLNPYLENPVSATVFNEC